MHDEEAGVCFSWRFLACASRAKMNVALCHCDWEKTFFLIPISQEATAELFIQKSARLEVNACLEHLTILNNFGGSSCSNEIAAIPAAKVPPQWEKFVSCICNVCNRKEFLDKMGRYADHASQETHTHLFLVSSPPSLLLGLTISLLSLPPLSPILKDSSQLQKAHSSSSR